MKRKLGLKKATKKTAKTVAEESLRALDGFPKTAKVVRVDGKFRVALSFVSARRLASKLPKKSDAHSTSRGMTRTEMKERISNLERILKNAGIDAGIEVPQEVIRGPSLGKRLPGSYGFRSG